MTSRGKGELLTFQEIIPLPRGCQLVFQELADSARSEGAAAAARRPSGIVVVLVGRLALLE